MSQCKPAKTVTSDYGCANLVGLIITAIVFIVIANVIAGQIEKRDNYILDLQRRVGQLESERR